ALFLQPGFLHERLAEDVVFLLREDFVDLRAGGELVLDDVLVLGDVDFVAGTQRTAERALTVDLHAVGAVQVADVPDSVLERQLAVCTGDVLKVQPDVARRSPTDCHDFAYERDGVAPADGNKFAEVALWHVSRLTEMDAERQER